MSTRAAVVFSFALAGGCAQSTALLPPPAPRKGGQGAPGATPPSATPSSASPHVGAGPSPSERRVRVVELDRGPTTDGCVFAGTNRDEIRLSYDGTSAGAFAMLYRGIDDIRISLGPPGGAARLSANVDFLRFLVRVAPDDVLLYAKRPLVHQSVFHTESGKPLRVTALEGKSDQLQITPLSWERARKVAFKAPTPFVARCNDFGLEPAQYPTPPFYDFPAAWLVSKVGTRRTTIAATPNGPVVLDVERSVAVFVSRAGGRAKVFLDTEDGFFSGFTDPRALDEPPGGLGHGSGTGTAPKPMPETRCSETSELYVLRLDTLDAYPIATIPKEAHFEPLGETPWKTTDGRAFVYVDLASRLKTLPGFRLVTPKGPAVDCRRSAHS